MILMAGTWRKLRFFPRIRSVIIFLINGTMGSDIVFSLKDVQL